MKIELSPITIVRYAVPGCVGVLFLFILPCSFLNTEILRELNTVSGLIIMGIATLVLGYLLDAFKVYKLTFGYKRWSKEIDKEITQILNTDINYAKVYLARAANHEEKNEGNICILHAKWVMAQKCTFIFYLTFFIWVLLFFLSIKEIIEINYIICLTISFICIILGIRLNRICIYEQKRIQKSYVEYIKRNKSLFASKSDVKGAKK